MTQLSLTFVLTALSEDLARITKL